MCHQLLVDYFVRSSFYFLGASILNSLPLSLRNINSRVFIWESLGRLLLVISTIVFNIFCFNMYFILLLVFNSLVFLILSQQDPVDNSTLY